MELSAANSTITPCHFIIIHRGRSRSFKEGGGGGHHECQRSRFSRGMWGLAPPEIFENLSL